MPAYSNAAYSNLAVMPSKRSAVEQRAAAVQMKTAEAKLKSAVDQANRILDFLEAREAAQADVINALSKRRAATAARIAKIEDEILRRMDEAGLTVLTGTRCSMQSRTSPTSSLAVVDESLIPPEYMRTPKPGAPTADKAALKKALTANDELDPAAWGCKLSNTISLIRK